ncbi:class I SAM-dependent methyltransferase [Methylophaga sp. OBS4]|uniref:class I SAM-dependent methyltransferase n=1 Tax=Methylophaga sp. OBS4 TaxID=2991935 RepID=UPI00224D050A|nr:class I SAM-dependent methyltransferase [Methylophaga sp. OBS4]MCX4187961.1 class I SAM-dependent methyltransferase [Methylophaga sp. OBS4]
MNKLIDSVAALNDQALTRAHELAGRLAVAVSQPDPGLPQLLVSEQKVQLQVPDLGKPVAIDFETGKYDHRRKFGGGRGQPLAKAIGLKKGQLPTVIDATAGFARDAFVIASLGCQITMLERSLLMSILIEDAVSRAATHAEITDIAARMRIIHCDAIFYLQQLPVGDYPDVVYMDPMYPSRDKSALVKKEMQLLHRLIGADTDSSPLLTAAREVARKRVVVKRPKGADFIGGAKPSVSIESKNTRYDVYVNS